jgi:hypothetical protein
MVTGGLAAVVYGHPRLTLDVDQVVRLASRAAESFAALWPGREFWTSRSRCDQGTRLRVNDA